uniref:Pseudouridine synthase RsuA/RluA-like domain-containing protein n=1 Tax=Salix viminalis TaxID=40686 RepID=A0A6N2LP46_SALVM
MLCTTTSPLNSFGSPWPDLNDGLIDSDTLLLFQVQKFCSFTRLVAENTQWTGSPSTKNKEMITIDGEVVKEPKAILRDGMELVYHRLPWREPDAPYLLQVLYEDDDMIALNKPAGLQVLPGGLFQQRTVLMQLQWRASKGSSSLETQGSHPVPVHRLGRGTSGILLCAKTKVAKTSLAAFFAEGTSLIGDSSNTNMEQSKRRKISKIYRALVNGILKQDKIIIKQPIGTMRYPGVAKGLYVASASGKPALSKVEVLERDSQLNQTLVQVEIESGRPHQIRIHLSFIGHPLRGDPLYDVGGQPMCFDSEHEDESFAEDGGYERPAKPVPGDCGYYLHAHQLVLSHPTTNEDGILVVESCIKPLGLLKRFSWQRNVPNP